MRVLVTGASGFLGGEVVRQAVAAGFEVVSAGRRELTLPGYRRADLLDRAAVEALVSGANSVIHVAGLAHVFDGIRVPPGGYDRINASGTATVARAAVSAGAEALVLVSSVSVYGPAPDRGCTEEAACRPTGAYAQSKWHAERLADEITAGTRTRLTILRMATLYGEGDPGNVYRLIRAIDRGRFLWVGRGQNLKSLVHRDDAARACLSALNRPGAGARTYNISGTATTMREIVDCIAAALGKRVARWPVPAVLARGLAGVATVATGGRAGTAGLRSAIEKWLADDSYDGSRFHEDVGFRPRISLKEGLRREVAWYLRRGAA